MPPSRSLSARDELMTLYLSRFALLRQMLVRRIGSPDLADEAMQETWIRLDRAKIPVDPANRQAWLLRVAGNIAADLTRKERRHRKSALSFDEIAEALPDTVPTAETQLIDRQALKLLVAALLELPAKPRRALLLCRCDGLTHAEIAARLGVSDRMVRKYLLQALQHCRNALAAAGV